jgi:hypothetical protein
VNITTAMRIEKNDDFRDRIYFLMTKAAVAKLNAESPTSADILVGQRILDGTEPVRPWVVATLTNSTIMAGAHQDDGSTIQDSDLEFQINSLWTAFSL